MTFIALQTNLPSESLGAKLAVNPEAFSLLLKILACSTHWSTKASTPDSASQIDFVPPRSASPCLLKSRDFEAAKGLLEDHTTASLIM